MTLTDELYAASKAYYVILGRSEFMGSYNSADSTVKDRRSKFTK